MIRIWVKPMFGGERFDIFVTAFAQLVRMRIVVSSDSLKNTPISEKTAL